MKIAIPTKVLLVVVLVVLKMPPPCLRLHFYKSHPHHAIITTILPPLLATLGGKLWGLWAALVAAVLEVEIGEVTPA